MKEILNIFSPNSPKPKKKKVSGRVVMDYREKNSLVYSHLIKEGLEVEVRELKVADYIVNDVAIERKTVSDFISSMLNRRLIGQLESMQQYKNRLLLIEGVDEQELYSNEKYLEGGLHPNSVRGFLLSIALRYKTPAIFTKNSEDTAKFISLLSKREKRELSLNVSKKSLNKKEQMQFILEGFPGIGPKTAKKLLEKFKTLRKVLNAPKEDLEETIGKKSDIFGIIDDKY